MTINSYKKAALRYANLARHVVPLNDLAESKKTNNTTQLPGPVIIGWVRSIRADVDAFRWKVLKKQVESFSEPSAITTAIKPMAKGQAGSSKAGASAQSNAVPNIPVAYKNEKDSDRLIRLAGSPFLFHNHDREAFATVEADGHLETWPVRSNDFKDWLTCKYFLETRSAPSANAMKEAIDVLEAQAKSGGPTFRVYTRVAEHEGNIYLDLADDDRTIVEITPNGWALIHDAPVKFRRAKGMKSLPKPVAGGSIDDLRPFVNVHDETDWMLIVAWLLAAFRPHGPYPLAALYGEHGSAKTTTARVMRALCDPNLAAVRSEPKDGRDLMISATNGWVIVLDNLSKISDSLSDALCRLSTGGGLATRKLNTDTDETILNAQRPVILTGIEELVTRGDLLDRSLVINLPAIDPTERKVERKFWAEFDAAQPRILGALLTVVAGALRELPSVELAALPRLADFAVWITAAEPALGWKRGAFMIAFQKNCHQASAIALESSVLVTPILNLISDGPWTGTAEQLSYVLYPMVPSSVRRSAEWPNTARGLVGALRRLNPNLQTLGVEITFERDKGHERTRLITIVRRVPSDDTGVTAR